MSNSKENKPKGRPKKNNDKEPYRSTGFCNILNKLFGYSGESQEEVANKLGTTRQTFGNWLAGRNQPDYETLIAIAKYYNVSTDYLLGLSKVKSPDNKVQTACEVTGLSEEAIEKLNNCYNNKATPEFTETISDIISCDSFFEMIEELWRYGETLLQTEYIENVSETIQEISNNRKYSIELRECFMKRFASIFDLSINKIYCDSTYRKECKKNYEEFGFPENFSIAHSNVIFLNESKNSLDLSEYNTVKRFQHLMNLYQEKAQKRYLLFQTSINDIVKKFYYIGFDEDRPLTDEEIRFKEYISNLFKEALNNGEHPGKQE
ncbi:helix-turn-helix domain-containing protein [Ruminococcus flavefaciens]|uniref:helix-turn-helix domain-containing protein n=1 Tax=Ruminococcus flavefaciens TaxID=1265 RepID=UPI0013DAED88|nr:helix-turn-helix domain-containing protein [Ruminococcus flavefaciens]